MNALIVSQYAKRTLVGIVVFGVFTALAGAQAAETARTEVPDGAPQLAAEKVINSQSQTTVTRGGASVIVEEERIQGRLANAKISVGGGKGYMIVDPAAGRVDRQSDNGGKRVSPSLWEVFRF